MKKLIFAFIFLLPVFTCQAKTITDNDGPAGCNNIQAAIDYASKGDGVVVQMAHTPATAPQLVCTSKQRSEEVDP